MFVLNPGSIAALAIAAMLCGAACAQNFPSKPVRIIVPYPPGGYTLCTVTGDGMLIIPRLRRDLPYNVERDFTPVVQLVSTTTILVSPASAPFNDFREMVAYAKANPGKLNFGSFGMGGGGHQLIEFIERPRPVPKTASA